MEYWIGEYMSVMAGEGDVIYVTRPSILTNQIHTITIFGEDPKQVAEWLLAHENREPHPLVQEAFPDLSDEEREFLLTGITQFEWNAKIGNSNENPD